ncbi:MAG: polyphosphate kinase 2 family protein, partial [Woeseia sp.]|nr:polyphosphate kinase 2 family protein [Woeseia sp.]
MFRAPSSSLLVPFDGSFRVADTPTVPQDVDPAKARRRLKKAQKKLDRLQRVLMAGDHHAVLLVFQAMDAAGKDS